MSDEALTCNNCRHYKRNQEGPTLWAHKCAEGSDLVPHGTKETCGDFDEKKEKSNMSNRTMMEFNHDFTPHGDEELLRWARQIQHYLSSGDPTLLPDGVTWFGMRHHTTECPLGKPPRGWGNGGF